MNPMLVVYVAGPFRGPNAWAIEQNIRRAEARALDAWRAGFAALCPHTNCRFFEGAASDDIWLRGGLALLAKCDALLVDPDEPVTRGVRAEIDYANAHGIPIFESIADLVEACTLAGGIFGRAGQRAGGVGPRGVDYPVARQDADPLPGVPADGSPERSEGR